ncbi:hypothetical protein [Streptomyces sp. DSM 40868]|uniref:hypothetical protein n=1 Tax=Streptomyces sp. DSM 40868 TaxID=2721173 RepID=UPI001FCCA670|nr:hypothetical protein [Streptomyces sp. DSM 40868]
MTRTMSRGWSVSRAGLRAWSREAVAGGHDLQLRVVLLGGVGHRLGVVAADRDQHVDPGGC